MTLIARGWMLLALGCYFAMSVGAISAIAAEDSLPKFEYHGQLSKLREPATFVGESWKDAPGLIVDDVSRVPTKPSNRQAEVERSVVDAVAPLGVVALADFTYQAKGAGPVPSLITARVFEFKSAEATDAFWQKKYAAPTAGPKLYIPVDGVGDHAVGSSEIKKRIVLLGNVLITCHQVPAGEDYLGVASRYVEKLQAAKAAQEGGKVEP